MMKRRNGLAVVLTLVSMAGHAKADPRESVTLTAIPSNGGLNASTNTVRTAVLHGGYTARMVRVSGSLTKVNTSTFAREARVQVTPPSGPAFIIQPFTTGAFSGTIGTTMTFTPAAPITPVEGTWSFRFFEGYDDPGIDSRWETITFTLDDGAATPPLADNLGTQSAPWSTERSFALSPGLVKWYRLELSEAVTAASLRYMDIETRGSIVGLGDDTDIALYNADGSKVAEDDDDGPGNTSIMSFGTGSGGPSSGGQDGDLQAGVYYLAIAGFDATFGPGFAATTTNTAAGNVSLQISLRPTPMTISGISPQSGGEGDPITIQGAGFGTSAEALAASILQPDGSLLECRVLAAGGTSMIVAPGPIPQGAQPGAIVVWRGDPSSGGFSSSRPEVVVEQPFAVDVLNCRRGPAAAVSTQAFSPASSPGSWQYSSLANGALTLRVEGLWPQNTAVRFKGRIQGDGTTAGVFESQAIRMRLDGGPALTSVRLAQTIEALYQQRLTGLYIACDAPADAPGTILVRTRATAGGGRLPVTQGSLAMLVEFPHTARTLSGLSLSAYGGATIHEIGDELQVHGSANVGGVTIDAEGSEVGAGYVLASTRLSSPGEIITSTAWGSETTHGHVVLGSLSVRATDNGGVVSASWPQWNGGTAKVQLYLAGALVGLADLAPGDLVTLSEHPEVTGGGWSALGVAYGWWTLGRPVDCEITTGVHARADQIRVAFAAAPGRILAIEAVDLSLPSSDSALLIADAGLIPPPPPCPADFNQDGGIDGSDVQEFTDAWEAGEASADVNRDGGVDGEDVAVFVRAWEEAGC